MKKIILIALSFTTHLSLAQNRETYQSDSVYKVNNVKIITSYHGTTNKLWATSFFDQQGRLVKCQLESSITGAQPTTYYTYDADGRLIAIVDTIKNGPPNEDQLAMLKKVGVDVNKILKDAKGRPPIEIIKYELVYEGNFLTKITHYNFDGSVNSVDRFENNGKTKTRDIYRKGKIRRQNITEYLTELVVARFYGWEIREGVKEKWDYTFKNEFENGRVKSSTRYEGKEQMETTQYFYNSKGLIIGIKGSSVETFGYTYY